MTLTNITPEAHALHCHARSHRIPSDMETGPTAKPLKRCDARHALSRLRPKDRAMRCPLDFGCKVASSTNAFWEKGLH